MYKSIHAPMKTLPGFAGFGSSDVLVLVGELFGRGYANGLVEEAGRQGMRVIGTTVGRRDSDGSLRPLTGEELSEAESVLGGRIINIPLEAGFDMEAPDGLPSVSEQLKKARPDDWDKISFDEEFIEKARTAGTARFRKNLALVVSELETLVPDGAKVVIAHTMAGGIPRARVLMPLLNRVFKGTGEKFLGSEPFWNCSLGKLCDISFNEVTADTFRYLIEETAALRERISSSGGQLSYTAYGYHGCGVMVGGAYRWQSYTPYVQGWAKMRLESIAADAWDKGVRASVFNCPEIQTNSSALFLGVEISLYPLLSAIRKECGEKASAPLFSRCSAMLKEGETIDMLLTAADEYLSNPYPGRTVGFEEWPQHNSREQAELMLGCSSALMGMHADQKQLVCAELSRIVFLATGRLMLNEAASPAAPVVWLDHDIIAQLCASPLGSGIL